MQETGEILISLQKLSKRILSLTAVSAFTLALVGSLINPLVAAALPIWIEAQPALDTDMEWLSGSVSGDGQTAMVSKAYGSYLISSGNQHQEINPPYTVLSSVMSNDGNTILTGTGAGVYLSTDKGANWTELLTINLGWQWYDVGMSDDGATMLASAYTGTTGNRLYRSTDGGANWTEINDLGIHPTIYGLTMSADGDTMMVGANGRLHLSADGGDTWAETQPAGNIVSSWPAIKVSDDGQKMIAGEADGRVYLSDNGGSTWTETQPAGNADKNWYRSAMSSDGQTILLSNINRFDMDPSGGRVYLSTDGGATWAETQPAGDKSQDWGVLGVSDNGEKMLAAALRVYTTGFRIGALLDNDNDGVSNDTENGAPHGGDGNVDHISDRLQAHVVSFRNPHTNSYVSLETPAGCIVSRAAITSESTTSPDIGFDYPLGLLGFEASCGAPGFTINVVAYYYEPAKGSPIARKYNPTTKSYFTVPGAVVRQIDVPGYTSTQVSYSATDGGVLDTDGAANGTLVDPVGLASSTVGVPKTGMGGTFRR